MLKMFFRPYSFRRFSTSRTWRNAELEKKVDKPTEPLENPGAMKLTFTPSELDKTILVLSGRFKSKADIPPRISYDTMDNAKSRFRIRGSNILMVGTLMMCGFYVWLGKKRAKEGESINKMILEKDKKILEDAKMRKQI